MTTALIPINYDGEQPTVSARALHAGLGIRKRFSTWFDTNSQGFVENEDYTSVLSGTVVNNGAIRQLEDYEIAVLMAKHLAMMSRTEKGKQIRDYLIDLEKAWNTPEQIFKNPEFGSIRTLEIDGKPYFVGKDIADMLGYSNSRRALKDHCRWVTFRYVPHPQNPEKEIGMSFIPESDIYRLIVRSKLPAAERFETWVFDEVLPSIRRSGGYIAEQEQM